MKNELEKEFVPYQEALALKELGFNKPCLAVYFNPTKELYFDKYINEFNQDVRTLAPTFSQAFRWFRDKYNIYQEIRIFVWDYNKNQLGYSVVTCLNPLEFETVKKIHLEVYASYEEAELACLRKLIEIVKQKKITNENKAI